MRLFAVGIMAATLAASSGEIGAQIRKPMSPSFDGWTKNADGTYTLYFGYLNRNPDEVEVPVGPDNRVAPASNPQGDGGQPTTFQTGRQAHAFRMTLPATFNDKITWTLAYAGRTETATGSLNQLYLIDNSTDLRGNKAPVSDAGPDQTVAVGMPVSLRGTISDDGLPKRNRGAAVETVGLTARWTKYRGPANVVFNPVDAPVTAVTFGAPGTYILRLRADDTVFVRDDEVTVTVTLAR
jgi:hypothetical protein